MTASQFVRQRVNLVRVVGGILAVGVATRIYLLQVLVATHERTTDLQSKRLMEVSAQHGAARANRARAVLAPPHTSRAPLPTTGPRRGRGARDN